MRMLKRKDGRNMNTRIQALISVDIERNRQDEKWGEQNHDPQYWTGILMEEVGEYAEAVNETVFDNGSDKGGYDNMMTELTHVAAVAVGAMECLMRNNPELLKEADQEAGQTALRPAT